MTAEDTKDAARELAHPVPVSLSPSSMGTFTSCPLAFRFGYIERLPEPPSAPASKGTLVHLALQHLMWRPPAERTLATALADLARAESEVAALQGFLVECGARDEIEGAIEGERAGRASGAIALVAAKRLLDAGQVVKEQPRVD